MFTVNDSEEPPPRDHPWTICETNPEARYYDFRTHPELISTSLEDFKPWSKYPAIARFYELLAWINGDDSIFESNDCGLRPPRTDTEAPEIIRRNFESDPIVVHGRLAMIFRNLEWNTGGRIDSLMKGIGQGLGQTPNIPAVVKVGEWKHHFTAINKQGRAVTLRFWAWGDTEEDAMTCLNMTFEQMHGCLQWVCEGMKEAWCNSNPPRKTG